MKNIIYFLERFQRRSLLIAAAVLLAIIYLGLWVQGEYDARQIVVESKIAQLKQDQLIAGKTEFFEKRLERLLRQKEQVSRYFFIGEDEDKLSSAMQLRIQALVSKAGMQAESISSTLQKADGKQEKRGGEALGEVLVKARLAGTLTEFMNFMADLYRGKEFFEIVSISLKPYKRTGLKVFVELKGFYILQVKGSNSGKD